MKMKNRTVKIILFVLGIAAVCVALYFSVSTILSLLAFLISLFFPFILAYAFAAITKPLAATLEKRLKIPRSVSAILVIILVFGILGGLIGFAVWKIVDEVRSLYTQLPDIVLAVHAGLDSVSLKMSGLYNAMPEAIRESLSDVGNSISERVAAFINSHSTSVVGQGSSIAKQIPGILVGTVVFLLSSYFMISDDGKISEFVHRLIPQKHTEKITRLKDELKKYLGGYFRAQGILMCITFVILFIALMILGVKYALLLAFAIAFLDALPFFGSGAALWPWAAVSFINGNFGMGVGLIITYVCIVATRQFIEPKLVSSRIGVHPLLTLMSMYVGYRTLSIGGMILGPVILMLVMSFYKAGLFDSAIALLHRAWELIKKTAFDVRDYIKNFFTTE